tara:strand:+ start:140 stop:1198 length:1059 start_codon:yes stop_codon:yes gene_type:complete
MAFMANAQDITVFKTSTPPMIDGTVDTIWGQVEPNVISANEELWSESYFDYVTANDYEATFKVLWSNNDSATDSLYFLIELTDNEFVSDFGSIPDGAGGIKIINRGHDDGFDVFFNPGLRGEGEFGAGELYRMGIVTGENDENPEFWFRYNQITENDITNRMQKAHTVDDTNAEITTKYVFEFAIGLKDFDPEVQPTGGYKFGVDFRYNDDDGQIPNKNGSTQRDGQYSWALGSELNIINGGKFNNYNGLGTATLSNEEVSAPLSVNNIGDIKNLNIYPNPAKDHFVIQTAGLNLENARVEVLSLSGQTILVQQITTTQSTVEVNISSLTSGLYLVRLISNDSNFVAKLIVE